LSSTTRTRAAGSSRGFSKLPGAVSAREEVREIVLDALQTLLTPDEELDGEAAEANREHLPFTAAA
jgi:hypothetical protein